MENLKALQDELIYQKSVIEEKSGYVTVANTNPSPYEITEGIKTIPSSDLSQADATEADVAKGKTFYAGNSILKTGIAVIDPSQINAIFLPNPNQATYDGQLYYVIPEHLTSVRKYCFYKNYNKVEITFQPGLTVIDDYSFSYTPNFSFVGFHDLVQLYRIGINCFQHGSSIGIDYSALPNSIETIDNSAFDYTINHSLDYRFPDSLKYVGACLFRKSKRTVVNSLDLSNYKPTTLTANCFQNLVFNCDLVPPNTVQQISSYFNYGGCFKNIILPPSIKTLQSCCFASSNTDSVSNYHLSTVVFNGENIPKIEPSLFATQHVTNGFKIYVPDTVLEEYKAVTNLAPYVSCIYPMSEKE